MCRVLWLYRSVDPALLAMASDQQQPECKEFWVTLAEVTHYLTQDGHEHVFHEWGVTPGSKRNGREAILGVYAHEKKACWQKFAVNACLTEARRVRRQQLNPIHQQELTLNAQERLWRTEQRNLRLQNKTHAPEEVARLRRLRR